MFNLHTKAFRMVLIALCFASGLFANDNIKKGDILYATKVKNLFLEEDKAIGRLLPTAKIEVLSVDANSIELKVKGYVQEGAENAIYYVPNRRILNAALSRTAGIKPTIGKQVESDSDKKWYEAELVIKTAKDNLTSDVKPLYKTASENYVANCSICHSLYDSTKFKANQWPSIVKSMGMRSGMDNESLYLLTQFLQKNAGDMPKQK